MPYENSVRQEIEPVTDQIVKGLNTIIHDYAEKKSYNKIRVYGGYFIFEVTIRLDSKQVPYAD
jgi:hypothetical protein